MDFVAGKFLNHTGTERRESGDMLYFVRQQDEQGGFVKNSQIEAWSVSQLADAITTKLVKKHDLSWTMKNCSFDPNSEAKPLSDGEYYQLLDLLPTN